MGNDWKALEHAQAALALIPEMPPSPLKALALGNLANMERILGDYEAAIRHMRQAQAIAEMVGAQPAVGHTGVEPEHTNIQHHCPGGGRSCVGIHGLSSRQLENYARLV